MLKRVVVFGSRHWEVQEYGSSIFLTSGEGLVLLFHMARNRRESGTCNRSVCMHKRVNGRLQARFITACFLEN